MKNTSARLFATAFSLLITAAACAPSPATPFRAAAPQSIQQQALQNQSNWDFRDESIYFVMTDRFVDGDPQNNNLYGDEFRPGQLTFYQGGDFKGLIQNLDHIKDMGFTSIWVTPPVMQPPGRYLNEGRNYEAAGYHGYWAWDFSKIDPHLESPGASYDDFIQAAHAKGLKVIQDIVTNHAHGNATAPEVKWHEQRHQVWGKGQMFDFGNDPMKWFHHGGPQIADLMDFNDQSDEVLNWMIDIYKDYQNRGVDAFRIDTMAWMRPEFWAQFSDAMHANKKDFFMFGEVWTNGDFNWLASYTHLGSGQDYPMNSGVSVLDMPGSAMNTWGQLENTFKPGGDYTRVDAVLQHDFRYQDASFLVSYLDNHDKPRFNGTGGDGRQAGQMDYIDALNWYFTARGIPCIYYGTEVQMQGGNDPDNRRMLGQQGIQASKNNPVYWQLRKLNALRHSFEPLQKGQQQRLSSGRDHYAFRRDHAGETAVVLLNKGNGQQQLSVQGIPDGQYTELYTGQGVQVQNGQLNAEIPAHGLRIFALGRIQGQPWSVADWKRQSAASMQSQALRR